MNTRLPLGSILTLAAINCGILVLPYTAPRAAKWEAPPEPYPYAGPRVEHVEVKGKRKGTRRERKAHR